MNSLLSRVGIDIEIQYRIEILQNVAIDIEILKFLKIFNWSSKKVEIFYILQHMPIQ